AYRQLAFEPHPHGFWPPLNPRLRREHMVQLAGADTERQRPQPAMGAGMAVAADDQAARKAEAKLGPDHMDDALPRLIDIEHPDAGRRRLGPQARQKLLSDLAGAGPSARRRDRMIRRCECQFRIVHGQVAVFEIEQARRGAQIVQQMTVDVKQISIVADASDHVLVPDFGQQGSAGRLHCRILPFFFFHGSLIHRHRPFCTACYSGLRPNSLQTIKTYWSLWANASFGGPGPTPARDPAGIEAAPPNPSRP